MSQASQISWLHDQRSHALWIFNALHCCHYPTYYKFASLLNIDNVGSRLVWWFWLIKSLGKIIQNPAIDLMVLINKKFVPGESQISHTNSLSCSCHAPTTTTTTTTTTPPLHHQQLPSWKANLFLKKNDHKIAQGLVEKPCPFLKPCPQSFFQRGSPWAA